ncbi:hypothetical protein JCM8547_000221 [Rhodosporidiobolus lusitaniae]
MSVVSHAAGPPKPSTSWPPPLPSSSSFSPLSSPTTSSPAPPQHIPLRREDFPLLHSLLESPAYSQLATAREPSSSSSRRPRHGGGGAASKPPKSASAAVNDLWKKVPRAAGAASSVVGHGAKSRATVREEPEKMQTVLLDGLIGVVSAPPPKKEKRVSAVPVVPALPPVRNLPPIPSAAQSAPQLPFNPPMPPALPSTAPSAPPPSLPYPLPPALRNTPIANPYPTRIHPAPQQALHLSTSTLQLRQPYDPEDRPPTAFKTAVGQLKRMLTRSSRRQLRRPSASSKSRSPSSLGGTSIFSASTIFGQNDETRSRRDSGLSVYSPSSPFVDLAEDVEELAAEPLSPSKPPDIRRSSWVASSSLPPEPMGGSPPTEYGSLPPSFRSPLSFSITSFHPSQPQSSAPPLPRKSSLPARTPSPLSSFTSSSATKFTPRSPLHPRNRAAEAASYRQRRDDLLQLLRDGPPDGPPSSPEPFSALPLAAEEGEAAATQRKGLKWQPSLSALPGALGRKISLSRRGSSSGKRQRPSPRQHRSASSIVVVGGSAKQQQHGRKPSEAFSTTSSAEAEARLYTYEALHAPPAPPSPTRAPSPPRPALERAHSLDDLLSPSSSPAWVMEKVEGRPASTYEAYGSRWMREEEGGVLVSAPAEEEEEGRRGLGRRREGEEEEEEEERRVWRKWRGWVRERREKEGR